MRGAAFGVITIASGVVFGFWACGDSEGPGGSGGIGANDAADAVEDNATPDGPGGAPNDASPDVVLPDGGLPSEHAWLADASIWKAVPGTGYLHPFCSVFEADPSKLQFPPLQWGACGSGCELADVVQGYGERASFPVVASTVRVGSAVRGYLALQHGVETVGFWYKLLRVVDLDAATIGAVQLVTPKGGKWSHCSFGNGRESALASSISGSPTPTVEETWREMHAFTGTSGNWTWSQPPRVRAELPPALIEFDLGEAAPVIIGVGAGTVAALTDVSKNTWTTLESASSSHQGAGEGDLGVWTDYPTGTTERVRGWSPTDGKGVRTIVDPAPFETCQVVPTPTHLVGLLAEQGACGSPTGITTARLWRTPRAYDPSGVSLTLSPPLPGTPFVLAGGFSLKSWGDYAAAQLWELDASGAQVGLHFLVVQLSTWKAWRIDPRPNTGIHGDAWTITDDTFYFGENDGTPQDSTYVRRMVRVQLTELASFAKALN